MTWSTRFRPGYFEDIERERLARASQAFEDSDDDIEGAIDAFYDALGGE